MSKQSVPQISVIMPFYNVEQFIEGAVQSVLHQNCEGIELLGIDDGSADQSAAIFERAASGQADVPFKLLRCDRGGASAARNVGIAHARGEYVAFLDADDVWDAELLSRLLAAFRQKPEADLLFPMLRVIDENGHVISRPSPPQRSAYSWQDLLVVNPIHSASGVVAKKKAVTEAGGFDASLRSCTDLDLWIRIGFQRKRNLHSIRETLASYRRRDGQITQSWRRMRDGWERVLEKAVASRGAEATSLARQGRGARSIYWSTLAYQGEDYRTARRLLLDAWRLAPRTVSNTPGSLVRTAACGASYLPPRVHTALRTLFVQLTG